MTSAWPPKSVPSVILFRGRSRRRPSDQVWVLRANLSAVEADLAAGAVVIIGTRLAGTGCGIFSAM